MRVLIATVSHPFIKGGAEAHADGLIAALQRAGHEADIFSLPFRFSPWSEVLRNQTIWEGEDLRGANAQGSELLIALKYPAYAVKHDNKIAWLLHQHRAVYELYDPRHADEKSEEAKNAIRDFDTRHLGATKKVFANSRRVAERLRYYNGVESEPLYHPPPSPELFYCGEQLPYILCPSRLETLKRQDLLIEAMRLVNAPVNVLIVGTGGQQPHFAEMIRRYNLGSRIKMCGYVPRKEQIEYYANCLGVFFGPFDEDLGYVTMEAMLAGKPVITCHDSGGPTEFLTDGETGLIADPTPLSIAQAIDRLWADRAWSAQLGRNARDHFVSLDISWDNVTAKLTEKY